MLLSDRDIKTEIESGRVKLDPYDPELIQPSSIDVRMDRYFRVFENHRYPHIDPAVEQPDLTRLIETDDEEPFVLHPSEFVLASTFEVVTLPDDIAGRLEGKSSSGAAGPAHALDGGLDRPRVLRARDPRAVQRSDAADQAVAGDEDRPTLPVPDQFPRRTPVRLARIRLPIPRPARPDTVAVVPELLPRQGLRRARMTLRFKNRALPDRGTCEAMARVNLGRLAASDRCGNEHENRCRTPDREPPGDSRA